MTDRSSRGTIALVLAVLALTALLLHDYSAQPASRFAFTAALVERQSVALDGYEHTLGIDRAVRDGRTYSDKAPGQPFLAVPFYWLATLVGAAPGDVLVIEKNTRLWWMMLWSSAVPGAALAVLMRRSAQRVDPAKATVATLLTFFGTLLLPFSAMLFGHVLSALMLFAAYLMVIDGRTPVRLITGGLLAGLAVLVEYTAVVGVAILVIAALVRYGWSVLWMVVGGVPMAGLLMWYNAVAFGGPFTFSYQFSAFSGVQEEAMSVTGMFETSNWGSLFEMVLGGRGLLVATPVVIVAVFAAIQGSRNDPYGHGVALAIFLAFAAIPAMWPNPWGGDSPGPRYLAPCLPFLVIPLTSALTKYRRVAVVSGLIGVFTMVMATMTDPLVPVSADGGLGIWISKAATGDFVPTLVGTGWPTTATIVLAGGVFARAALTSDRRAMALRYAAPSAHPGGNSGTSTETDENV